MTLIAQVIDTCPRSPVAKAIGAMVGLAAADSLGHWFEFMDACDRPGANRGGSRVDVSRLEYVPAEGEEQRKTRVKSGGRPACFEGEVFNKFALQMGQWTDDCSMGLAMADSLIVRRGYDGSDIRIRFWNWWNKGYCNAFGRDDSLGPRPSVGLGGNISKSIYSMKMGERPSSTFESHGEDSGNGSIMRLAPIPLFFATPLEQPGRHPLQDCMDAARESSYTTHPGAIAAECCALLAYLVSTAIHDPRLPLASEQEEGGLTARRWLEEETTKYLAEVLGEQTGPGFDEVRKLLASAEPEGSLERNWNWRSFADEGLAIEATLRARGHRYNGHPVSAGYFGSYAVDGLAMALHCVSSTTSANAAIERCINFLGDADSTGAVAGQLAGAIYGISGLHPAFVQNLQQWDEGEVAVRAYMLHFLGQKAAELNYIVPGEESTMQVAFSKPKAAVARSRNASDGSAQPCCGGRSNRRGDQQVNQRDLASTLRARGIGGAVSDSDEEAD
jgi:ADP-ribosyl-[dinitrogen reductase] hydrolase